MRFQSSGLKDSKEFKKLPRRRRGQRRLKNNFIFKLSYPRNLTNCAVCWLKVSVTKMRTENLCRRLKCGFPNCYDFVVTDQPRNSAVVTDKESYRIKSILDAFYQFIFCNGGQYVWWKGILNNLME